jgi:hypothetical protein
LERVSHILYNVPLPADWHCKLAAYAVYASTTFGICTARRLFDGQE